MLHSVFFARALRCAHSFAPSLPSSWESGVFVHEIVDFKPFHPTLCLQVSTLLCSTKLTQNLEILNVFNWRNNLDGLQDALQALMKVQGEEIVKFLQDVCDSLFSILIENKDCDRIDNLVFDCLVYIITLMSDRKYSHFTSVLDLYIAENFSATLAYMKLIACVKYYVDQSLEEENQQEFRTNRVGVLQKALASIQFIFKFIIRSWKMFSELREGQGRESFVDSLKSLFDSLTRLMSFDTEAALPIQGKHASSTNQVVIQTEE